MGTDLRLKYASDYELDDESAPAEQVFIFQDSGRIPMRFASGPPQGRHGANNNQRIYQWRIAAKDFKLAVPYILGFADFTGGGMLKRTLPITDPDGLGMIAVDIPKYQFTNYSGLQVLELPESDNIAPDGNVYDNVYAEDFFGPFDVDVPENPDLIGRVAKQFRYCILDVLFEHVLYTVTSDEVAQSGIGERERFMFSTFTPSFEYVSLAASVLTFFAGPHAGDPVGSGAGFVRPTGEIKIQWFGVPDDAYEALSPVWENAEGTMNDRPFQLWIGSALRTFDTEQLIFQPVRTDPKINPAGFLTYDVTMTMGVRKEGWNRFLDIRDNTGGGFGKNGNYYDVIVQQTGFPVYLSSNFDDLFAPF